MNDQQEASVLRSGGSTYSCDKENKDLLQYGKKLGVNGNHHRGDSPSNSEGNRECFLVEDKTTRKVNKNPHCQVFPVSKREYILNVIKRVKGLGKSSNQKDIDPELLRRCYNFSSDIGKGIGREEELVDNSIESNSGQDTVRQEIKRVIGCLEEVLDELNHVVGDLRSVVTQIDDITTEIEARGSPDSQKTQLLAHVLPPSPVSSLPNEEPSFDSGFVGSSLQRLTAAVNTNTGDECPLSSSAKIITDRINEPNTTPSTSCGNQGHNESHSRSIAGPRKTTPPLCKKCQLRSNNAQMPRVSYKSNYKSSNSHSSVCSKLLQKPTKHTQNKQYCLSTEASTAGYYAKVARPQGGTATNCSIKSRSISRTVQSDGGDFYERQLEQRLENLSAVDCQSQGFSTLDWFTLEKRSYSDTICKGGDNGSDRESGESSEEEDTVVCKHKEGVLKASDTFRFKIKQISMRKMNAAHWRVVIQP